MGDLSILELRAKTAKGATFKVEVADVLELFRRLHVAESRDRQTKASVELLQALMKLDDQMTDKTIKIMRKFK